MWHRYILFEKPNPFSQIYWLYNTCKLIVPVIKDAIKSVKKRLYFLLFIRILLESILSSCLFVHSSLHRKFCFKLTDKVVSNMCNSHYSKSSFSLVVGLLRIRINRLTLAVWNSYRGQERSSKARDENIYHNLHHVVRSFLFSLPHWSELTADSNHNDFLKKLYPSVFQQCIN